MNATLVHNPSAGVEKPSREQIIKTLTEKGYQVKYVSSKEDQLEEVLKNPGEMVIVAGGDGTVGKISLLLMGRNIPIGILSLGTANNIAMTLQSCGLPELQIETWDLSHRFSFDVGKVRGNWGESHFFESVGFGILTRLMAESMEKKKSENIAFNDRQEKIDFSLQILKEILPHAPSLFYHVEIDGEDYSGKYFLVEVMNIRSVGPHLTLAPEANPSDGLFDVVLLSEGERDHLLQYVEALSNGEKTSFNLKKRQAAHIQIHAENNSLHIDDEIIEIDKNKPVKISLEQGQLSFL